MKIQIWGTRASIPVSGSQFNQFGGNTSCIEVSSQNGDSLILDGGSGLGAWASASKALNDLPTICLTSGQLDKILGLPFLSSMRAKRLVIYGPASAKKQVEKLFDGLAPMRGTGAPEIDFRIIAGRALFNVGDIEVEALAANPEEDSLAYKIKADGMAFAYSGDHEIPLGSEETVEQGASPLPDFMAGCDIALVDSHFSEKDHATHEGRGHSHPEQWAAALKDRKIGKIFLGLFNHYYSDDDIDLLLSAVKYAYPDLKIECAREGMIIEDGKIISTSVQEQCPICEFFKKTAYLSDTHAVLDAILTEARRLSRADAGSVYLVKNDELIFSGAQNDTLFPASGANKFFYLNARLTIDKTSIAGYVAATRSNLNIVDVYKLPPESEYAFKADFDQKSGYRTQSVLTVPLLNAKREVVGVLQLINSMKDGRVAPFTERMEKDIASLAAMSTVPLERSFLLTNMILRMLRTSSLRDPGETAGHVYRVGAMAAELYHRWAESNGVEPEELLATKGILRLAAMLHDVGKVGIPDAVLKKPGKLDDNERSIMQKHAAMGANLFDEAENGIDRIAHDIALHHHAKWDGSGYTGDKDINSPSKNDIPIWARITAIADVYDALVSRRCYKEAWDSSKALDILQKDAGTHFDPELVKYFIEIKDIVDAIMQRYQ